MARRTNKVRRTIGVVLTALLGGALPSVPAASGEAGSGAPVDRVVVRTSAPVHTKLRVEYPVQLSTVAPGADLRLRSTGKLSGFAIVDAGSKRLAFAGFRDAPCMEPKCDGWVFYYNRNGMLTESGNGSLDPGTYDLHVLSDGHPVELTLEAPGLELVRPGHRTPSVLRDLRLRELRSNNFSYAAATRLDLDSPALVLTTTWTKIRPFESVDLGVCLYDGAPLEPALAYHARCDLLGAKKYGMLVVSPGSPRNSRADMSVPVLLRVGAGEWGLGAFSEVLGVRRSVGTTSMLLEL